jgi:hypothetical protein
MSRNIIFVLMCHCHKLLQKRNAYKFCSGNLKENYFEVLGVGGSIILKLILNRMGECGLESSGPGY